MKKSTKATGIGVPKSDSQLQDRDFRIFSEHATKTKARKQQVAAIKIQRAWFMYVDKSLFQLLKHTVCAAEYCVSHELLKKVSPLEAALVKDPSMKCKVRFRLCGDRFPPSIVFKIFFQNDGHGYKYFSGKNLLKPSSEPECLILCLAKSIIRWSENLLTERRKTSALQKISNQHLRKTDSKMMGLEINSSSKKPPLKSPTEAPKEPKNRGAVGHKVPLPEHEDPRFKCKDCGAFGHTARSKKCPIKNWDGATVPQPLGAKKEKENMDPRKLENTKTLEELEKEKELKEKLEQQKAALLLKFPKKPQKRRPHSWKDLSLTGAFLRRPSRPMFINMNMRKRTFDHVQMSELHLKKSEEELIYHAASPKESYDLTCLPLNQDKCQDMPVSVLKTAEDLEPCMNLTDQNTVDGFSEAPQSVLRTNGMSPQTKGQSFDEVKHPPLHADIAHTHDQDGKLSFNVIDGECFEVPIQNFQKKPRVSTFQAPQESTERPVSGALGAVPTPPPSTSAPEPQWPPQAGRKIPVQVLSLEHHLPHSGTLLNSPCTENRDLASSDVPGKTLKMVFTRLTRRRWSSKIVETPSSHPPKMQAPKKYDGVYSWLPQKPFTEDCGNSSSEYSDEE